MTNEIQKQEVKPVVETTLEKAENLAKRIEEANKKTEELLERQERVKAEALFSGRTETGMPTGQQKTPEEIKKDGAMAFFKGSDIERAIKKYG